MENLLETIIISSMIYTFYKFILNYEFFSEPKLYIKYNNKYAQMPYRATKESAGLDLFSCDDGIIEAHSKKMIDIGISIKIPIGYYGRIAPRSGLTIKNSIDVGAGVIDSDYRGNVSVILFNHGDEKFIFKKCDKLAQLIIEKIALVNVVTLTSLDYTERGVRGFGSTGISNLNIGINYNGNQENYSSEDDKETFEEETIEEETIEEETIEKETVEEETIEEETIEEENTIKEKNTIEEKNTSEEETIEEKTIEEKTTSEEETFEKID
jgi:dUTP pyrophosphatase|tara:strand:+ start:117 stop:920 length:804 start_codon:yes stop_codon:yes gene_type:complete